MAEQDNRDHIRKIKVDLQDLEDAFDGDSWFVRYYLDLETGEVIWTTEEVRNEWEKISRRAAGSEPEGGTGTNAAIGEAPQRSGLPTWMKEAVEEADRIETGLGIRYLEIPPTESRDRYQDMEDFIATVQDGHKRDRLFDAIRGRGAFRRFRDVVGRYPDIEERWYQFKRARAAHRALEWLESEGIAPACE